MKGRLKAKNMGYELREYQKEAIQAMENIEDGEVGLIALPTGAGKTVVFATVCNNTEGRCLIVVPSTELRDQAKEKLLEINPLLDIGLVQGSLLNSVANKICIATRQSLSHKKSKRIEAMNEHGDFQFIVIDESHNAVDQIKKILDKMDISKSKVIGFTATPFNPAMTKVFNKINYSKDLLWMIENNYLCEPKAIQVSTNTDLSNVRTVAGEFNQRDLEEATNTLTRNDLVVKSYIKYCSSRKRTLVFCSGIDHSNDLAEEFVKNGVRAKSIDSSLSAEERENIIEEFKNGEINVLCNVSILTTGVDIPAIDSILFCRPTKSKILYLQCLGRGLRLSENKENCLIMDFKDIVSKHNLLDLGSVFDMDFKNNETLSEAKERIENEAEEEKLKKQKQKEEQEAEKIRQEEIIARQIELFNSNLNNVFRDAYYDWFEVVNNSIYAVSESMTTHFIIQKYEDEFFVFKCSTPSQKENRWIRLINTFSNVNEAIEEVNSLLIEPKSFAYRKCDWKQDLATENQRKYCRNARTKWQAHVYFTSYSCKCLLEKYWKESNEE